MFKRALREVERILGSDQTDSHELHDVGVFLFEDKFKGVFASDEIHLSRTGEGYYIVNLDTSRQQGSHWVALAVRGPVCYYFDSFARTNRSTLRLNDPHHIIVQERNPCIVQGRREENCGQRSLAWLMVFDQCPRDALSL